MSYVGECLTENSMLPMPTFPGQFADYEIHATDAPFGGSLGSYLGSYFLTKGLRQSLGVEHLSRI